MDFGPAYFLFGCEKWTLWQLINSLPGLGHGLSLGLGPKSIFTAKSIKLINSPKVHFSQAKKSRPAQSPFFTAKNKWHLINCPKDHFSQPKRKWPLINYPKDHFSQPKKKSKMILPVKWSGWNEYSPFACEFFRVKWKAKSSESLGRGTLPPLS